MALAPAQRLYLGCFFLLHFFLLITVSYRDALWILGQGYTSLPASLENYWKKAEAVVTTVLGQRLASTNPVRQTVTTYLHGAGIEKGYGFFAPGVPNSYKLVFELKYGDGRIEYELPRVTSDESGLRLATLLDHIGRTEYDPLRAIMLKMLAYPVWQEHPDAINIRAVFGSIEEPRMAQALQGKKESYRFLYACDFTFAPEPGDRVR